MTKINFQNLPGTTTPVNDTNLNQLQTNVENTLNTYSTTEVILGKWIDDRPIYRKVVSVPVNNLVGGQTLTVAHGISNLRYVVRGYGICKRKNASTFNVIPGTYTNWEIYLYDFGATYFSVRASANQVSSGFDTMYIIIEYTKTTD